MSEAKAPVGVVTSGKRWSKTLSPEVITSIQVWLHGYVCVSIMFSSLGMYSSRRHVQLSVPTRSVTFHRYHNQYLQGGIALVF